MRAWSGSLVERKSNAKRSRCCLLQRIDRKIIRAEGVRSILLFVTWTPGAMTRASNVTVYGSLRYCPAGRGRPISPGLYKVPLHLRGSLSVAGTMRGRESWRSSMIVRRRTADRAGGWPPRVVQVPTQKNPDLDAAAAVLYQVSSGRKYFFACVSYCTSDCSGTDKKQKKLGKSVR